MIEKNELKITDIINIDLTHCVNTLKTLYKALSNPYPLLELTQKYNIKLDTEFKNALEHCLIINEKQFLNNIIKTNQLKHKGKI